MFWNRKREEYEKIDVESELISIKSKIARMEAEILDILTAQATIRDKVLRKIRLKNVDDEELNTWAGIPKSKDFNNSAF